MDEPQAAASRHLPATVMRGLVVSLAAAFLGSRFGSWIILNEGPGISAATLPFTLVGSLVLLLPGYAAMRESGLGRVRAYGLLLLLGTGAGALMLLPFGGELNFLTYGASFGALTTACWIALHLATARLEPGPRPASNWRRGRDGGCRGR